MGKILVMYDTQSDRKFTSTVVPLIEEGIAQVGGMEVRAKFVDDCTPQDVFWADGIALGCPTHLGGISWRMKKWWDDNTPNVWMKTDGKLGVAFTSSGSRGGGGELTCLALNVMMMNCGYMCFGITDYIAKKESLHYGAVVAGEPREEFAKESCRRVGRRLAEWVAVIVDGRPECHPLKATYPRFPRDY